MLRKAQRERGSKVQRDLGNSTKGWSLAGIAMQGARTCRPNHLFLVTGISSFSCPTLTAANLRPTAIVRISGGKVRRETRGRLTSGSSNSYGLGGGSQGRAPASGEVRHRARVFGGNVASEGTLAFVAMQAALPIGSTKRGFRPRAGGIKETCLPPPLPCENKVMAESGNAVHTPRS